MSAKASRSVTGIHMSFINLCQFVISLLLDNLTDTRYYNGIGNNPNAASSKNDCIFHCLSQPAFRQVYGQLEQKPVQP